MAEYPKLMYKGDRYTPHRFLVIKHAEDKKDEERLRKLGFITPNQKGKL